MTNTNRSLDQALVAKIHEKLSYLQNISKEELLSHDRVDYVVDARKMFVGLIKEVNVHTSSTEIGTYLRVTHSPHSRANYYLRLHLQHYETDKKYKRRYDELFSAVMGVFRLIKEDEHKAHMHYLYEHKNVLETRLTCYQQILDGVNKEIEFNEQIYADRNKNLERSAD